MKRLLFVCGEGHIFRSLVKLKGGRVRQCPECAGIVSDSRGCKNIFEARKVAKDFPGIQVFVRGRIERRAA